MIHFSLHCETRHSFDGWFTNAGAFEVQLGKGLVTCPVCGSSKVGKALMAPALATGASEKVTVASAHPEHGKLVEAMRALRQKVLEQADYVGDKFAVEARKIHDEEVEPRGIYGEATREEVTSLIEDGIEIMPLPQLPEEHN